jgi:hypothetical protein
MSTRKKHRLPPGLEAVRRRFERWRLTHTPRSRIPDALWDAAVRLAGRCGVHRTARALRLQYYSLKDRVERQSAVVSERSTRYGGPAFLELSPPADHGLAGMPVNACECTLELEDAGGAKMRVHLKTAQPPDLAALSRSFWNPEP